MPSSTFTSTTLPVIFDEMVARRRAVTYPVAFSTAACVPATRSVTGETWTSIGRSRVAHAHPARPRPASTTSTSVHTTTRTTPERSGGRSIRSAARSVFQICHVVCEFEPPPATAEP